MAARIGALFCGPHGAGKTSLIHRLASKEEKDDQASTVVSTYSLQPAIALVDTASASAADAFAWDAIKASLDVAAAQNISIRKVFVLLEAPKSGALLSELESIKAVTQALGLVKGVVFVITKIDDESNAGKVSSPVVARIKELFGVDTQVITTGSTENRLHELHRQLLHLKLHPQITFQGHGHATSPDAMQASGLTGPTAVGQSSSNPQIAGADVDIVTQLQQLRNGMEQFESQVKSQFDAWKKAIQLLERQLQAARQQSDHDSASVSHVDA